MKIKMSDTSKDRIYDNITGEGGVKAKSQSYARKLVRAAVIAASVCVCSGTVYAAYRWMNAGEVASMMGKSALAEKFNKTDDEIQVQENDVYRATYLGEVSGKNLSEYKIEADEDKSYFVMAIERKDDQEITYDEQMVASPFVKGVAPWQFNIYYLGGGAESYISDNVLYRIIECTNVEIFADKGLYLGITEGAPGNDEYQFDEKSGEISRNPECTATNFLFELNVDKAKADPAKAEQLLEQCRQGTGEDETEEDLSGLTEEEKTDAKKMDELEKQAEKDMENMDEWLANSKLIKGSVKELEKGEDGYLKYTYEGSEYMEEEKQLKKVMEKNKTDYVTCGCSAGGNTDSYVVEVTIIQYKDGKYIGKVYTREYVGNK